MVEVYLHSPPICLNVVNVCEIIIGRGKAEELVEEFALMPL
jgi:hypothetical protein